MEWGTKVGRILSIGRRRRLVNLPSGRGQEEGPGHGGRALWDTEVFIQFQGVACSVVRPFSPKSPGKGELAVVEHSPRGGEGPQPPCGAGGRGQRGQGELEQENVRLLRVLTEAGETPAGPHRVPRLTWTLNDMCLSDEMRTQGWPTWVPRQQRGSED